MRGEAAKLPAAEFAKASGLNVGDQLGG
jgi:hypothetical protein